MPVVDDVFLSRVGHDLRGELATMVAGVHYLMRYEEGLTDAGRQMLDRVNGAGQRLKRLLDELELAVWIDGGPPDAILGEPIRLPVLVHAALARLERSIAQRSVTVDAGISDDLPEFEGDPELLGAAVEYALDFAVARSPGCAVHVTAAFLGPAPVLVIADEGEPAPPALLDRLFDPFVEKDLLPRPEPGARRRERLGLGLSIARGILAAHGGALTAATGPGGRGIALTCKLGPG